MHQPLCHQHLNHRNVRHKHSLIDIKDTRSNHSFMNTLITDTTEIGIHAVRSIIKPEDKLPKTHIVKSCQSVFYGTSKWTHPCDHRYR